MGLEDWQPTEGVQYDLVWVQWCVGHLTDVQLIRFLRRCKSALNDNGVIVLKENNSTADKDLFDNVDSSVTRYVAISPHSHRLGMQLKGEFREDDTFRRIFRKAGLRLIQVELQKGLQVGGRSLLPVSMYALKPAQ